MEVKLLPFNEHYQELRALMVLLWVLNVPIPSNYCFILDRLVMEILSMMVKLQSCQMLLYFH